jgi:fructosamine-3-kinase
MSPELTRALSQVLGSALVGSCPLGGGDIHAAFDVQLGDGRRVFIKTHDLAPGSMFAAEARGLAWLRNARALRVPNVLYVSEHDADGPRFLVLEYLEPKVSRFDERLGHGLAALHRFGAPSFGLDHDNFIGALEQSNAPSPNWAAFYRERRLEPQLRRAASRGLAAPGLRRRFDELFARLDDLVGPAEPPSRLHGDLWAGNLHVDDHGEPCLIDPAVYGGHREVDLAMMRLFGGFPRPAFDAYHEAYPLSPGHEGRIALYQLYPLLVHLNHFGSGYGRQLAAALDQALKN